MAGGAIAALNKGLRLVGNKAELDGGGVHIDGAARLKIHGVNNVAALGGGRWGGSPCDDPAGQVRFEANLAGYDAAGVQVNLERDGGGLYAADAEVFQGPFGPEVVAFEINRATRGGGALAAAAGAIVDIDGAEILSNVAELGDGGGVLSRDGASLVLQNALVELNTAPLYGGGLAMLDAAIADIDAVEIRNNVGGIGGGVAAATGADVTANAAIVELNTAEVGGGVSSTDGASFTFVDGEVSSNTAEVGGGMAAYAATATFGSMGCALGAPCLEVLDNAASGGVSTGGALALGGGANVVLRRARLVSNKGDQGAAIYLNDALDSLDMFDSAVLDSRSDSGAVASAVLVMDGALTVKGSTIAHNDLGIRLVPPVSATMSSSLVIENLLDISGLALGASLTGDCNAVTFAATAGAIFGSGRASPLPADASVDPLTGQPINSLEIIDKCVAVQLGSVDLFGQPRTGSGFGDRGAIEL